MDADLLLVSGGWNPNVALWTHARGTLRFDERIAAFVPDTPGPHGRIEVVGAAAGDIDGLGEIAPTWVVPPPGPATDDAWATHYVDTGRDATVRDLQRALGAGLESIEHVKRYTTIGTGVEQGRSGGVVASAIAASILGQEVGAIGVPTFRPPTVPVSFAQLAGRHRGPQLADPVRTTPIQPWHVANGAVFEDVGQWKRPRYFPRDGETMDAAVLRECAAARTGVAVMDATTLGKIDLQGPDVAIFLDRVYTRDVLDAQGRLVPVRRDVPRGRDGLRRRRDVADRRRPVPHDHHDRQCRGRPRPPRGVAPDRVAGASGPRHERHGAVGDRGRRRAARARGRRPRSRPDLDVSNDAFPFMTWREAVIAGTAGRVFRISFSGELAFELNVPTWHGLALWEAVMAAGEPLGITPYGTETMHVLRAEKGYPIIGQETDGTVTPQDLGMAWAVSTKKDFIGRRSHRRPDAHAGRIESSWSACCRSTRMLDSPRAPSWSRPTPTSVARRCRCWATSRRRIGARPWVGRSRSRSSKVVATGSGSGWSRRWWTSVIEAEIVDSVVFDPENRRRDGEPDA